VFTVRRWQRYGKDRLYLADPDGTAVGWYDLVANVAYPEQTELADQLAGAVVGKRGAVSEHGVAQNPAEVELKFRQFGSSSYGRTGAILARVISSPSRQG